MLKTNQSTLDRFTEILLSSDSPDRKRYYCQKQKQFFFNRDRNKFEAILFFYQSCGKLFLPPLCSLEEFIEECEFFRLPKAAIDLLKLLEGAELMQNVKNASRSLRPPRANTISNRLRNVLDYPNSSIPAILYFTTYCLLIVVSIIRYCIETLPGSTIDQNLYWTYFEIAGSGFFLLDFLMRFFLSRSPIKFLTEVFTIIDIITIPSYTTISLLVEIEHYSTLCRFLKALQFFRIARLLRFGKMSRRVSIVYAIVKDSLQDLRYFFVCLLVIVTTSGSIVYSMEKNSNNLMTNIPESMWWSLQAYLTIGYGDVIPQTVAGKTFSAFYMAVGILTLMLPMLSLILKLVKCTKEINLDEKIYVDAE